MKLTRLLSLLSALSSLLYLASYLLTVEATIENHAQASPVVPHYQLGGKVAAQIFKPLHHLDTCVRTKYWQGR